MGGDDAPVPPEEPVLAAADPALEIPETLEVPEVLDLTDRLLAERGRRSHLFAWLRRPEGGPADWLAVAAYYPGNRVVVVCENSAGPYRELFAELVPAHGLRLLEIGAGHLAGGRQAVRRALEDRISELGSLPERAAPSVDHASRAHAAQAPPQPPVLAARRRAPGSRGDRRARTGGRTRGRGVRRRRARGFGPGERDGCLRACPRCLLARPGNHRSLARWILRMGRVVRARRSPVVAWFALFQEDGPVRTEPAPLAGMVGILALVVLAVALLAAAL